MIVDSMVSFKPQIINIVYNKRDRCIEVERTKHKVKNITRVFDHYEESMYLLNRIEELKNDKEIISEMVQVREASNERQSFVIKKLEEKNYSLKRKVEERESMLNLKGIYNLKGNEEMLQSELKEQKHKNYNLRQKLYRCEKKN